MNSVLSLSPDVAGRAPDQSTDKQDSSFKRRTKNLRVAIVHYWLFHMRGGEKVLEELCRMFPQADIYTHIYDAEGVSPLIRKHNVRTTFIQKLPFARKLYQKYLPLMPMALEQLDLSDYDLVISSESGPAKGVIVRPDALHICYCHTPMRYLWDQFHEYHRRAGFFTRAFMALLMPSLRQWDVTAAARVDAFIANSTTVAQRIERYWRRSATVVHPPTELERFAPGAQVGDHYLYVGELVAYKRVDIVIAACALLDRPLKIIGAGPELKHLKSLAGPKVEFLGRVSALELADNYASCRALLFPGLEDFGIVPVEAMASGRPVIAYGRGGALDSVADGVTGLFFATQSAESMAEAIVKSERIAFDSAAIRTHAEKFSAEAFQSGIAARVVAELEAREPKR